MKIIEKWLKFMDDGGNLLKNLKICMKLLWNDKNLCNVASGLHRRCLQNEAVPTLITTNWAESWSLAVPKYGTDATFDFESI